MHKCLHRRAVMLGTIATLAGAACQGRTPDAASDVGTAGRDDATAAQTPVMEGMPGMQGMQSGGMMAGMKAHMDTMSRVTQVDRIQRMLPMHRQMTANMLAEMNREMRSMNMSGDKAWTALIDSVRQDLRALPGMDATQLRSAMPAHHARVTRLMQMHGEMMLHMKM